MVVWYPEFSDPIVSFLFASDTRAHAAIVSAEIELWIVPNELSEDVFQLGLWQQFRLEAVLATLVDEL